MPGSHPGRIRRPIHPRIERLLRFHGMAAPMVKQVAKDSGPLCRKCLSVWSKDLASNSSRELQSCRAVPLDSV